MRILIILALAVALSACGKKEVRKPDLPGKDTLVQTRIVYVDRIVYVKIKPELTQPLPIAEGPIGQCFAVAAARRAALEKCNANLKQIDAIEGTEVKQ